MLSSDAILIRDGKQQSVPASEIVPGDVVMLGLGDKVPADIRLLEVNNLASQEAALTGESVPIDKVTEPIKAETGDPRQTPLGDRKNMCFSATLIAQGSGIGLAVATGDNTEIGTINNLVNKVEEKKTAVLEQIDFIAKVLAGFITITALVTWLVAFYQLGSKPLDALTIALTCAVAMIPEGLDAIVTMTYSWAVAKMAKGKSHDHWLMVAFSFLFLARSQIQCRSFLHLSHRERYCPKAPSRRNTWKCHLYLFRQDWNSYQE
jgi:magnesium-transporting ATPase (P-type)